jgi:hypothetical protein
MLVAIYVDDILNHQFFVIY